MRHINSGVLKAFAAVAIVIVAYFAGWNASAIYQRSRYPRVGIPVPNTLPSGYFAVGIPPGFVSGNVGVGERVDILLVESERPETLVFDGLVMRSNPPTTLMIEGMEGVVLSDALRARKTLQFRPTVASSPPDYDAQLSRSHSPTGARAQ